MTMLEPGFAYVEIQSIETESKNGQPLMTKNGQKMVKLVMSGVDIHGNKGYVYDIIVSGTSWKVNNVTASFEVEKISRSLLVGRGAGAIIEHREYEGKDGLVKTASVKSYVPLEFFNMVSLVGVHGKEKVEEDVKKFREEANNADKHVLQDNNTDDDLPF